MKKEFTGFISGNDKKIYVGDICVGKTDFRHPWGKGEGLVEQGTVEKQGKRYLWKGFALECVFRNIHVLGDDPKLLVKTKIINHIVFKDYDS